jgi:hypothetical protein
MGITLIISVALPSRSSLAMLDLVKAAYVAGSPDLLEADLAGLCVGQQPLSATRSRSSNVFGHLVSETSMTSPSDPAARPGGFY